MEYSGEFVETESLCVVSNFLSEELITCVSFHSDSFANVVDLLDDMFERAAQADEPTEMNFIKKHAEELKADGVSERAAARLFSNP